MTIPSWARVGAKCVCTRASWNDALRGEKVPHLGQVLTIRSIVIDADGAAGLTFVEVVNSPRLYIEGFCEATFSVSNFRPLVTTEDDIETHFAQHLHTKLSEPV